MEAYQKNYSLGKYSIIRNISNIDEYVKVKVKFCAFADYEYICFLPDSFKELVKIISKVLYPNDFTLTYLDSEYEQHSIFSDATYMKIIKDAREKEANEVKFIINLYNHNKAELKNKEKINQISQKIKEMNNFFIKKYNQISIYSPEKISEENSFDEKDSFNSQISKINLKTNQKVTHYRIKPKKTRNWIQFLLKKMTMLKNLHLIKVVFPMTQTRIAKEIKTAKK